MREVEDGGSLISWSGFAKSASRVAACAETGVRARFLRGRLERGSADVGIDSGIGSDIFPLSRSISPECLLVAGRVCVCNVGVVVAMWTLLIWNV